MAKTLKYKNYGQVDFEDHEVDEIQEKQEKINEEVEKSQENIY